MGFTLTCEHFWPPSVFPLTQQLCGASLKQSTVVCSTDSPFFGAAKELGVSTVTGKKAKIEITFIYPLYFYQKAVSFNLKMFVVVMVQFVPENILLSIKRLITGIFLTVPLLMKLLTVGLLQTMTLSLEITFGSLFEEATLACEAFPYHQD
jgi:hypothetical protein